LGFGVCRSSRTETKDCIGPEEKKRRLLSRMSSGDWALAAAGAAAELAGEEAEEAVEGVRSALFNSGRLDAEQDRDCRRIPPSTRRRNRVHGRYDDEDVEEEEEEDLTIENEIGTDTPPVLEFFVKRRPSSYHKRSSTANLSLSSMTSETSEEDGAGNDPRQVGMENAVFGDYDMKKSPSTQDFVLAYIDDEMARRNLPGRLSAVANESLSEKQQGKSREQQLQQQIRYNEVSIEEEEKEHRLPELSKKVFQLTTDVYLEGVESIVDDNFWKCFQSKKPRPWNWNMYLWPLWAIGVVVRYLLLFPIRLTVFALGWIVFAIGMLTVQGIFKKGPKRIAMEHRLIMMMCGVFCITWGAVIHYHGSFFDPKPGQRQPVYVANHTSMIDVIILQQMRCFSLVGQRHKGIVRFLQEVVLGCLQCVWFDRGEIKDRAVVAKKLRAHSKDPARNPLLVFPEGTCVNNEYVIQFKKGIFEIGAPVVPIAIKYNKMFVDPFWNSSEQSFVMHLVELMTSWCLICDVWILDPHVRRSGESSEDFAARVKRAIADRAGLKNVNWDGYMKYWKPSERYMDSRRKAFSEKLRKSLEPPQSPVTKS